MKLVQSFWSRPMSVLRPFTGGWPELKHYWYAWVLSSHQARATHGRVELVTDRVGAEILIDRLDLPFDRVDVCLDQTDAHPGMWTSGKVLAYARQDEPFLHIESDVFLWKPLEEDFAQAPLLVQQVQHDQFVDPRFALPLTQMHDLPPSWARQAEFLRTQALAEGDTALQERSGSDTAADANKEKVIAGLNRACHTGVFGGHDIETIHQIAREVIRFVESPRNRSAWLRLAKGGPISRVSYPHAWVEQCTAYAVAAQSNTPVRALLPSIFESHDRADIKDRCESLGFTHVMGEKSIADESGLAERLESRVKEQYPDQHARIEQLLTTTDQHPAKFWQAASMMRSIVAAGASIVKTEVVGSKVPDPLYRARLEVCQFCPGGYSKKRNGKAHTCGPMVESMKGAKSTCGCLLKSKAKDPAQACPMGYWPRSDSVEAGGEEKTGSQDDDRRTINTNDRQQAGGPGGVSMPVSPVDTPHVMGRSERRAALDQIRSMNVAGVVPHALANRQRGLTGLGDAPQSLYDWFDRVVVLNLDRRPDRWEQLKHHLADIGWPFRYPQRFGAVDGRVDAPPVWWKAGAPAWGCYLSHTRVIENAIHDGVQSLLVLEDDVIFTDDFRSSVKSFLQAVPDDWHSLYFGGQHIRPIKHPPTQAAPGVFRAHNVNRMHAYAMRGDYLGVALDHLQDLHEHAQQHAGEGPQGQEKSHHVDHRLGVLHETGQWNIYCPERWLAGQSAGKSDICAKTLPDRFWQRGGARRAPKGTKKKFLILAHPRSGTQYCSKLMQAFGLDVGHERMGRDGICSWMLAVDTDYAPYGDGTVLRDYEYEHVIRLVRHPLDVLASSIFTENIEPEREIPTKGDRCRDHVHPYAFKERSWVFRKHFVQPTGNRYEQAVQTLLKWDEFIQSRQPVTTLHVESAMEEFATHFDMPVPDAKFLPGNRVNARKHPRLSWEELKDQINPDPFDRLSDYTDHLGYDLKNPGKQAQPIKPTYYCKDPSHRASSDCLKAMRRAKNRNAPADVDEILCLLERLKICIIRLRKKIDAERTWPVFDSLVKQHGRRICQEADSRWLVSILDTYADYGTPEESRNAMLTVLMMTWERFRAATIPNRRMWDGLTVMGKSSRADAHRNLFDRLTRLMQETPQIGLFFEEVLQRSFEQPHFLINQLGEVSARDLVADIRRVMKRNAVGRQTSRAGQVQDILQSIDSSIEESSDGGLKQAGVSAQGSGNTEQALSVEKQAVDAAACAAGVSRKGDEEYA